ncbi:hypothetical protein [Afipia clevelandensis]|uniref:Uncharacterized protein n=1 Tax=Afipia clevelandensis ATCC 49720 TaxID=883079 RepID=K8PB41_9BRAD|nr:hypothetical protein [Afipia clevelandensis]EKS38751.1 hypothetical protein HMPREF9696_01220 [Afipia clevelandensis ATCC 49720]
MEYEYDPEVPYWRADVDAQALYDAHGRVGPEVTDLLLELELAKPSGVDDIGPVAIMDGRFSDAYLGDHTFTWIFTPGEGPDSAIVIPIWQDGRVVDLLALSADDVRNWGCVTGKGIVAGTIPDGQPVRVYEAPWRWVKYGCDGVVILAKSAFPALSGSPVIYAESIDHAENLAERVFVRPVLERPDDPSARLIAAENAELEARDRIHIDEERYDEIDEEILQRAVVETVAQLKLEGIFN